MRTFVVILVAAIVFLAALSAMGSNLGGWEVLALLAATVAVTAIVLRRRRTTTRP